MKRTALTEKMIVVGVDGLEPRMAKKFMDQGLMPNLKKLVEKGSAREDLMLLGGVPTVTPPMWTTLSTGANPITHGITAFSNQHPTKYEATIYALDSRMCKAEQLWNVFAEAGKGTLVWHWPGSSWPPTSDSPNLSVVDGTQPSAVNMGTALVDWETIGMADETIKEVVYAHYDSSDKGVNGCVITDIDVAAQGEGNKRNATMKAVLGSSKESTRLCMSEEDTEVVTLAQMNVNHVNSPIVPAYNWSFEIPADAKEFVMLISDGYVRRNVLILKNEDGIYDRIAIYKNKKTPEPLFTLTVGEYKPGYIDEYIKNDERKMASRCMKIFELSEDGSHIIYWMNGANDMQGDKVWHPKSLFREITENVAPVPATCLASGKSQEHLVKLGLPAWDYYCNWQADCLTYLMDTGRYEIIFSHIHNLDAMGHKFWHYAKHFEDWNNDAKFYQDAIEYMYKQTDNYIGRFLPYLDEGWTIIVTSDHGLIVEENHPPVIMEGSICVPVMQELGYTVLKKDENGNEIAELDLTKTTAVIKRGGQVYINLKGRWECGIVEPEDKYELEDRIISDLYNYRDPHTGKRVIAVALRNKDAVILGMGGPECGDIITFAEEGYNIIHMDSLSTQEGYFDSSVSPIFVAAGPGIKEGYKMTRYMRQIDVAPTMAALGGVRMPRDCDGGIVTQILTEDV